MAWLFVPGAADSNSDCILSCVSNTAAYVLSKGKPTRRPASWTGWKKRPWARRLSGMTLPRSSLTAGLDSWISSLWACRANPTHAPGENLAQLTRVISGLTHGGIFASLIPHGSMGKTSSGSSPADSSTSRPNWKQTATALLQESLARRKSARRILESAFSSLENGQNWPTPNTIDQKGGTRNGKGQKQLCHAVKNNWPTPAAAQCKQGQNEPDGRRGQTLVGAVRGKNFATPTAHDCKGKGRDGQLVTDLIHGRGQQGAAALNSPGKLPGLLNPDWEEQLMGWVSGQSAFTCSEKELFLYLRRWRLWLFGKN